MYFIVITAKNIRRLFNIFFTVNIFIQFLNLLTNKNFNLHVFISVFLFLNRVRKKIQILILSSNLILGKLLASMCTICSTFLHFFIGSNLNSSWGPSIKLIILKIKTLYLRSLRQYILPFGCK